MSHDATAYGLWGLVLVNSAVFILFAASFYHPKTRRDWRSFGGFAAFLVALFTEMYGFPLTVYLLSGWLGTRYPGVNLWSHDAGHLWNTLLGWKGNPHFNPIHILSSVVIGGGFLLLSAAWPVLLRAQRAGGIATTGPYARIRHPQYVGFVLIMLGFLLQWPTLPTLVLFPILVTVYVRLARREERAAGRGVEDAYARYAATVPAFVPRWRRNPGSLRLDLTRKATP